MPYSSPPCYLHEFDAPHAVTPGRGSQIKRVYDDPAASDGYRILVDRLWPRGVSKKRAALDAWLRELAPSPELRQWFAHRPDRFAEFSKRYRVELRQQSPLIDSVRARAAKQRVTLLYAARDPKVNHALVLRQFIEAA